MKQETLLHIYQEKRKRVRMQLEVDPSNQELALGIIHHIDSAKAQIIQGLLAEGKRRKEEEKKTLYRVMQTFGIKLSRADQEKVNKKVMEVATTDKLTKEWNETVAKLQKVLNDSPIVEKARLIKDVSAAINNITGGG